MKVKMTFTIPEDVAHRLKDVIAQSQRSAFVANTLREKLQEIEQEQLKRRLIEGYIDRLEEDQALNEEWEAASLENWP